MRRDVERLRDIIEAIDAIEKYTVDGRKRFDNDELVRTWCLRHIEIIGEAVSRLSVPLRDTYSHAPWREVIGTRNALIHGYFDIDWSAVWNVVERDLPPFKAIISEILKESSESDLSDMP